MSRLVQVLLFYLASAPMVAAGDAHDQDGFSVETALGLGTNTITQGDSTLDASVTTMRAGVGYHRWNPSLVIIGDLSLGQPHLQSSQISQQLGAATNLMQATVQLGAERKLGPWLGRATFGPTWVALASPRVWALSDLGWKTEVGLGKWFALPYGFRAGGRASASMSRVTDSQGAWWGRSMDVSFMLGFD